MNPVQSSQEGFSEEEVFELRCKNIIMPGQCDRKNHMYKSMAQIGSYKHLAVCRHKKQRENGEKIWMERLVGSMA